MGCDLLSFYYLCRTGNSFGLNISWPVLVVICFHFTTFAVLETAGKPLLEVSFWLWFAFILLPLPYWKQQIGMIFSWGRVVICFHFTTFAVLETANRSWRNWDVLLWFAFILLPLPYWKQPKRWEDSFVYGCDLLSFYYLCRTGNSASSTLSKLSFVVICFHFTTFAVLETACLGICWLPTLLWFAFILLPLPYWKQPLNASSDVQGSCDLLSFYYLCRTGNSGIRKNYWRKSLWFAFILLPLPYWKQPSYWNGNWRSCCDLLSFYYLCRTGNSALSFFLL